MSSVTSEKQSRSIRSRLWPSIRFIMIFALLAWILRSLISAPFSIPSGSMMPTMLPGDYLFTAKWPYGYSSASFPGGIPSFHGRIMTSLPERGDVVIFRHPVTGTDWVKRVIGLPGDRIAVREGQLYINDRRIRRDALPDAIIAADPNTPCAMPVDSDGRLVCRYPAFRETLPNGRSYMTLDQVQGTDGDDFDLVTVPQGHLFLMGDNRDDSLDSRFSIEEGGIAFVPVDRLIGRAAFAFWSTDGSANYLKPWTWFSALRSERLAISYQP